MKLDVDQEKLSLLSDMIAFAVIDGVLHDKELDFIELVAIELSVKKDDLYSLFKNQKKSLILKDETERICHFYRLALLMHCDDILHTNEYIRIHELGIQMGLNPQAMKRILKIMEKNDNKMISASLILSAFQEQHN